MASTLYGGSSPSGTDNLPSQSGQSGKVLKVGQGETLEWGDRAKSIGSLAKPPTSWMSVSSNFNFISDRTFYYQGSGNITCTLPSTATVGDTSVFVSVGDGFILFESTISMVNNIGSSVIVQYYVAKNAIVKALFIGGSTGWVLWNVNYSYITSDPLFSDVSLLLFNSVEDYSSYSRHLSSVGEITEFNEGGGHSVLLSHLSFAGGGSYIGTPALNLKSIDFTVECFYRVKNNLTTNGYIATTYNLPGGAQARTMALGITSTNQPFVSNGLAGVTAFFQSYDTWHHVAFTYQVTGGIMSLYVNGVLSGTISGHLINSEATTFFVGGSPGDNNIGSHWFKGDISMLKVTRNHIRYTADFDPSTDIIF